MSSGHVCLLLLFNIADLLPGSHHVLVLDTHDTTSPDSTETVVVVVPSFELLGQRVKVDAVFLAHISHCNTSGGL